MKESISPEDFEVALRILQMGDDAGFIDYLKSLNLSMIDILVEIAVCLENKWLANHKQFFFDFIFKSKNKLLRVRLYKGRGTEHSFYFSVVSKEEGLCSFAKISYQYPLADFKSIFYHKILAGVTHYKIDLT